MRFDIITIFPKIFDSYFNESILRRAREKKIVDIRVHNLRDFTTDKRRTVDDKPYGGGPGMVLKIEPIARAIDSILKSRAKNRKIKIILLSAAGRSFTAKMATDWVKRHKQIILIAGHYEGVDARLEKVIENWKLKIENFISTPFFF